MASYVNVCVCGWFRVGLLVLTLWTCVPHVNTFTTADLHGASESSRDHTVADHTRPSPRLPTPTLDHARSASRLLGSGQDYTRSDSKQAPLRLHACSHCHCTPHYTLVNCSRTQLYDVTQIDFPSLVETLLLHGNHLTHLPSHSFSNLTRLSQLVLRHNRLSTLEPDTFYGLTKLRKLDLSNNQLSGLPAGLFTNLPHLNVLKLSQNNLNASLLQAEAFCNLGKLKTLDISYNPLDDLERLPDSFASIDNLKELDMINNNLHILSDDFFFNLEKSSLEVLNISSNPLNNVSGLAFSALVNLTTLDISNTSLSAKEINHVFEGLQNTSIQRINMKHIFKKMDRYLHHHTFDPLENTAIEVLNMNANYEAFKGGEVHNNFFRALPVLRELYLDLCMIDRIHVHAFSKMEYLEVLSLKLNFLNCVKGCDFLEGGAHLPALRVLDLTDNVISDLGSLAFIASNTFPSLQVLSLRNNRLSYIRPGMFRGLHKLEILDLSYNPLAVVTPNSFNHMKSLQTLMMNGCRELRELVAGMLHGPRHLRHLQLENNKVEMIDHNLISGLTSLNILSLRGNRLRSINITIDKSNLTHLDLSQNKLVKTPRSLLAGSLSLQALNLSQNSMPRLSAGDLGGGSLPHLTLLDVSDNAIVEIASDVEGALPGLQQIQLGGNPLECGCRGGEFLRWLDQKGAVVTDRSECLCQAPQHVAGTSAFLHYSRTGESTCTDDGYGVGLPIVCFFLGLIVATLTATLMFTGWKCRSKLSSPPSLHEVPIETTSAPIMNTSPVNPRACGLWELISFTKKRSENGRLGADAPNVRDPLLEDTQENETHIETIT